MMNHSCSKSAAAVANAVAANRSGKSPRARASAAACPCHSAFHSGFGFSLSGTLSSPSSIRLCSFWTSTLSITTLSFCLLYTFRCMWHSSSTAQTGGAVRRTAVASWSWLCFWWSYLLSQPPYGPTATMSISTTMARIKIPSMTAWATRKMMATTWPRPGRTSMFTSGWKVSCGHSSSFTSISQLTSGLT